MSEEKSPRSVRGCLDRVICPLGLIIVAFLFLPMIAGNEWLLELIFHLVGGWVLHVTRAISHFATDLPRLMHSLILPSVALAIAMWGAHRLVLWWRNATGKNMNWHFKHTALAGLLVLLGSAAAIALSGVLHEIAWLPQGKIIESNRRTAQTMAVSNARQLGLMMFEYEAENDTRPLSLLDLERMAPSLSFLQRMMFVDLGTQRPPEPFVFLKQGVVTDDDLDGIVMIGPQMPERGNFVVLRADNSVTSLPAAKFMEVVKSAVAENPAAK